MVRGCAHSSAWLGPWPVPSSATLQQIGNSLGVTVVGLLYFGATARSGFLVSLEYLIGINLVLVTLLFFALPGSRRLA